MNEAVERYHRAGLLTQASLMVNGAAVAEAVRIAGRNPGLMVGLHLVVCEARPAWNGWRLALSSGARKQLETNLVAQFDRFAALGFPPSYFDGHMHLHLHPAVFARALPLAVGRGFRVMRLVQEPGAAGFTPWVMGRLSQRAKPALRQAGFGFVGSSFGLSVTGAVDLPYTYRAIDGMPEGWSELYFHPGAERSAFAPEPVVERIATAGIRLGNSSGLQEAKSQSAFGSRRRCG